MTIENLLFRFLKENGIYYSIKKEMITRNQYRKKEPKHLLDSLIFSSNNFKFNKLKCIFYLAFTYFSVFVGDSNSLKRRRFYRLNKKWKNFVENKCFVQHNIKINDIIKYQSLWKEYTARIIDVDGMYFRVKRTDINFECTRNIFTITEVNGEKPVINLYYKDENGNCYGKINGNYNEIQL